MHNKGFLSISLDGALRLLVWSVISATVAWAVLAFNPSTYRLAMRVFGRSREFSPVEMLTVLFFALAAVIGLLAAARAWETQRKMQAVVCIGITAAAAITGLEEVQWGQPMLGFSIPEAVMERNLQQEFTLHNLEGIHGHAGKLYAIFCLGALMLTLRAPPLVFPAAWRSVQAPAFLTPLLVCIVVTTVMKIYQEFAGNPFSFGGPFRWLSEFTELCIAIWALVYVVCKAATRNSHSGGSGQQRTAESTISVTIESPSQPERL